MLALCVLSSLTAAAAIEPKQGTHDSIPRDFHPVHVTLVVVSYGISVLMATYCFAKAKYHGGVRLPLLLITFMWTALVTAGAVAWLVTYNTSRNILTDNIVEIIEARASTAIAHITSDLESSVMLVEHIQHQMREGGMILPLQWPASAQFLTHVLASIGNSPANYLLYYGLRDGGMFGVRPLPGGKHGERERFEHFLSPHEGEPLPPWITCSAQDYANSTHCSAYKASGRCGLDETIDDFDCAKTCGVVPLQARSNCYSSRNFTDEGYRKLVISRVDQPSNLSNHETKFLPPYEPEEHVASPVKYDCRERPWFKPSDVAEWSAPYTFPPRREASDERVWFGITVLGGLIGDQAAQNRSVEFLGPGPVGRYPPEVVGAVGVDVTLKTASINLRSVPHTEGTMAYLVTMDDIVVGSSLTTAQLAKDSGIDRMTETLTHLHLFRNRHSVIYTSFHALAERFGGIADAHALGSVRVVKEGKIVYAVPLTVAGGLRLLLVIVVPIDEVLSRAEAASVVALGVTIGISFLCACLVFAGVNTALNPLRLLSMRMLEVAEMQLQTAAPLLTSTESWVHEVEAMQISFKKMLANLIEYRQYLPQSVLYLSDVSDGNDAAAGAAGAAAIAGTGAQNPERRTQKAQHYPDLGMDVGSSSEEEYSRNSRSDRSHSQTSADPCGGGNNSNSNSNRTLGEDRVIAIQGQTSEEGISGNPLEPKRPPSMLANRGASTSRYGRDLSDMLSQGLREKQISMVMFNVRDFHAISKQTPYEVFTAVHAAYLEKILTITRGHRGIVDEFLGDHVTSSYNTSLRSDSHRIAASATCCDVIKAFSDQTTSSLVHRFSTQSNSMNSSQPARRPDERERSPENANPIPVRVSCASVSGKVQCGNMGCQGMKKYTKIGKCVRLLSVLERWGSRWGVGILTDSLIACEAQSVGMPARKIARMVVKGWTHAHAARDAALQSSGGPSLPPHTRMTTLCELTPKERRAGGECVEWMYELNDLESSDPYIEFNKAFDALHDGRFTDCESILAGVGLEAEVRSATSAESLAPSVLQVYLETFKSLLARSKAQGSPPLPLFPFTCPLPDLCKIRVAAAEPTSVLS